MLKINRTEFLGDDLNFHLTTFLDPLAIFNLSLCRKSLLRIKSFNSIKRWLCKNVSSTFINLTSDKEILNAEIVRYDSSEQSILKISALILCGANPHLQFDFFLRALRDDASFSIRVKKLFEDAIVLSLFHGVRIQENRFNTLLSIRSLTHLIPNCLSFGAKFNSASLLNLISRSSTFRKKEYDVFVLAKTLCEAESAGCFRRIVAALNFSEINSSYIGPENSEKSVYYFALIFSFLVDNGLQLHVRNSDGNGLVHNFCWNRNVMRILVLHGCDINATNFRGETPLLTILLYLKKFTNRIANSQFQIIEEQACFLFSLGANPNIFTRFGEIPLRIAIEAGSLALIRQCIAAGGEPNAATDFYAIKTSLSHIIEVYYFRRTFWSEKQFTELCQFVRENGGVLERVE